MGKNFYPIPLRANYSYKGTINLGLKDKLKIAFSHVKPLVRPDYIISKNKLDPHWISGFTAGDFTHADKTSYNQ